jgi:hypothetical protein
MGKTFSTGLLTNGIWQDSSNNIGIGAAANASFKLQVTGATNLTGALSGTSATFSGAIITNTSAAADNNFKVQNSTNAYASAINLIANNDDGARYNYINSSTNGGNTHWQIGGGSVANTMIFYTNNNAERMRISNGGNVSIGTTNTSTRLNIQASANFENATLGTATGTMGYLSANGLYGMYIGIGNSGNTWLQSQRNDGNTSAYNLLLNPQGGNVGIGTSSPNSILAIRQSNTSTATVLELTNTSTGDNTTKAAQLMFMLTDTVGTVKDSAYVQSVPSSGFPNVQNADLTFATRSGDGYPTERMRITSAGNVGIAVNPSSGIRLQVRAETSDSSSQAMNIGKANGEDLIYVRADGYLYSVGAWSGSDIRLKENITDLDNGLQKVLGLKAKKFDLIDGLKNNFGFIAQEMQEVIPDAVSVFEEKEQLLAVRMDFIIPHLVKAIQEQQAQIEELKQIVATK